MYVFHPQYEHIIHSNLSQKLKRCIMTGNPAVSECSCCGSRAMSQCRRLTVLRSMSAAPPSDSRGGVRVSSICSCRASSVSRRAPLSSPPRTALCGGGRRSCISRPGFQSRPSRRSAGILPRWWEPSKDRC